MSAECIFTYVWNDYLMEIRAEAYVGAKTHMDWINTSRRMTSRMKRNYCAVFIIISTFMEKIFFNIYMDVVYAYLCMHPWNSRIDLLSHRRALWIQFMPFCDATSAHSSSSCFQQKNTTKVFLLCLRLLFSYRSLWLFWKLFIIIIFHEINVLFFSRLLWLLFEIVISVT